MSIPISKILTIGTIVGNTEQGDRPYINKIMDLLWSKDDLSTRKYTLKPCENVQQLSPEKVQFVESMLIINYNSINSHIT
jgi:hypothetical protein